MNIYEKLSKIQSLLKVPKKQFNSFGNYNFRSCEDILEAVKPICKSVNATIIITDEILQIGSRYYMKAKATLVDLDDTASYISVDGYAREEETKKGYDASQITGASSSYARKYALNGLFNIDDTKDSDFTNRPARSESFICEICNNPISSHEDENGNRYSAKAIRNSSLKKYGKSLCFSCAAKEQRRIEGTNENAD